MDLAEIVTARFPTLVNRYLVSMNLSCGRALNLCSNWSQRSSARVAETEVSKRKALAAIKQGVEFIPGSRAIHGETNRLFPRIAKPQVILPVAIFLA
jgi:hypothetical protein